MAFNNTVIARAAAGIFGLQLGYGTTQYVLAQSNSGADLNTIINNAFNDTYGGVSNTVVANAVVANVGLTGAAAAAGRDYILNSLIGVPADQRGAVIANDLNLFSTIGTDPVFGVFANDFNARVAAAVNYGAVPGNVDAALGPVPSATSFFLATTQDNITGSAGNDTFSAFIFDNANTLQSGDFVNGGAGVDTLYADMGSSQLFAVTPRTTGVENIVIRSQARPTESGDNNVAGEGRVDIDAERIVGATRFESNNSRADLIVEDVRILPSQITRDITVAFVDSDPGNVDFGVYFDQLTANRTSSSTLTLQIIDINAASNPATAATPLLNSPYDGVSFTLNGQLVLLQDDAINNATTYAGLLAAIQGQLVRNPLTNGIVTATLSGTFSVLDSVTGQTVTGQSIVLSATNATFGIGNYIASQGVPALSNLYTNQLTVLANTQDLITSTVVLDNVGRGSNGGDLVIGALSVGETSSSKGVDRFEITVERSSKLQNIDSTNNTLKEVTFKNGTVNGNVLVTGNVGTNGNSLGPIAGGTAQDSALPGAVAQHDSWGFTDVRLIDASAMNGTVTFDAVVTEAAFNKYIVLTDTGPTAPGDNTSAPGQTAQFADFIYSGGNGNDIISVQVNGNVAASNSNIDVGREDFNFAINGGAGNDALTLRMVDSVLTGGLQNWYGHQHDLQNVSIDGGAGNDTIRTPGAGDVQIAGGTGDDTIYTDNTGALNGGVVRSIGGVLLSGPINAVTAPGITTPVNPGGVDLPGATNLSYTNFNLYNTIVANGQNAIWAFNTDNSGAAPAVALAREISDLKSDALDTYNLYRATITVTFKGLTKGIVLPNTTFTPSDLFVNQSIKQAINLDPVLSKLLVAVDGPAYSLLVKSLIDGAMVPGDLTVTATAADAGTFSATELSSAAVAYGLPSTATIAQVNAAFAAAVTAFNAVGSDYEANFAQNTAGGVAVVLSGADSVYSSDNVVTPGAGNDVIVLGTDSVGATELEASNDTVAFTPAFNNDTIVNFDATGDGIDVLDLIALGGDINAAVTNFANNAAPGAPATAIPNLLNRSISIDEVNTAAGGNDTAAKVAALFPDSANTAVLTHVYIVVNTTTNVGSVYTVTDAVGAGSGASNVTAVLSGTIDLADTAWTSLTAANFA